ncbi:MAG: hypothetical protein KJ607_02485 [Bacteroidetes bacterium]|nr:hypothetical protein [Bacteroidota bacterium]
MKKVLLIVSVCVFVFAFTSCMEDCKECKIVTYDATGAYESETTAEEYCGENLDEVDGKSETDPQGIKTEYVCE